MLDKTEKRAMCRPIAWGAVEQMGVSAEQQDSPCHRTWQWASYFDPGAALKASGSTRDFAG